MKERLSNVIEMRITDAAKFPELEEALVRHMISVGDSRGYPIVHRHDKVVDASLYHSESIKAHNHMRFLQ